MKKEYISNIEEAIKSIESMTSSVSLLHTGNKMFAEKTLAGKADTKFAKWYYGEGNVFSSFSSFKKIGVYYNEFYNTYQTYYTKYDEPVKKSFFSSNKSKIEAELNELLDNLNERSKSLVNVVNLFKTELLASPLYTETPERKPVTKKEQVKKSVEKNTNSEELDYERKLYEEVAKVKKQLEKDYQNKMNTLDDISNKTTKDKLVDDTPKNDDINLDDEIRRILS